jgi:hypothetical protein
MQQFIKLEPFDQKYNPQLSSKCTAAWRKQYQPWNHPDEKFLFLDGVEIFIEKNKGRCKI